MSDQQPQRPPIKPGPFDVMSTWMYAEPVAGSERRPNLRVKVLGNVPRITVKTNVPDDKNNGRIDFHTDVATFAVIMAKLKELAEGTTEETSFLFEYNDHIFQQGKRSDKPMTLASVRIGKDRDNGKLYIAVLGYNRPKIQFFFGPSKFHAMKRGDGSEIDAAEVSRSYALGFVNAYAPMIYNLLISDFNPDAKNVAKAPTPGQGGGGGGYGGGNRQGGGGGGYNRGGNGGGGGRPSQPQAAAGGGNSFGNDFADAGDFDSEWT